MQVTEEISTWLSGLNVISKSEIKKVGENKYTIGKQTSTAIENGVVFGKILLIIANKNAVRQNVPEIPFPDLDSLKEINTPAARLYNWNVLSECFKRISVQIESSMKGQIIAGDTQSVFEFMRQLMQLTASPVLSRSSIDMQKSKNTKQKPAEYKDEIDISKIDLNKPLNKCKNCLEFLVTLLSKHLSLPAAQTASLFTHNNKYLAHLFAKGVKGLFDPIIAFYEEVYQNVPLLIALFKGDPTKKNMHFTMNCLKPGLVSKEVEIAFISARLFDKLGEEFSNTNLLTVAWDWFVGENGGLSTTLLGLKRHPQMSETVVSLMLRFSQFNFIELFTTHLRKVSPDVRELLNSLLILLKPLTQSNAIDEIFNSGVMDEWIELAIENSSADDYKNNTDVRIASLAFLSHVWMTIPDKIEQNEQRSHIIMALLHKASLEKHSPLLLSTLTLLFELLSFFANQKSQYAPNIYRTLTMSIIENHDISTFREFALKNFMKVFESVESIPLNILVEPLIRQIQLSDEISFSFNIFDFEFFEYLSKSEKLQLKFAIQILDLLFKVYLKNILFAGLALSPIINITRRFAEDDSLQEFVIKFIKVALAMFYSSEKKKKPKERNMPMYNNKNAQSQQNMLPGEIEAEIVSAQKRALIVQIIKGIVDMEYAALNDKIKPLVAHTNIQIKSFSKQNSKGLMNILSSFGSADVILQQYEQEFQEHQNALRQEQREKEQSDLIDKFESSPKNQSDVYKAIEENLKKYTTLTKDEINHLALLRNPRTNPKVLKNLQQVKQNYNDREEAKKREQQKGEQAILKEKETVRKALIKRSLEQGIPSLNQKDIEGVLLFPYGSREHQQKRENPNGIPVVTYIDIEMEEQREIDLITILLKKYNKLLKNTFVKYANSGFSSQFSFKNLHSFDQIKGHSSLISVAEIYKFIKDYEFSDRLSKEEHQALVRNVAQEQARSKKKAGSVTERVEKSKSIAVAEGQSQQNMFEKGNLDRSYGINDLKETKSFDFQGFVDYIIQFSGFICQTGSEDYRHLPLSAQIQKVFDQFKQVAKRKGQSIALFEDIENQNTSDSDLVKSFNKTLETNPEYVLPQGFKKMKERELKYDYQIDLNGTIPMSDSFKYAYLLVNDILKEKFNFSLIEPKSIQKEVLKAVPTVSPNIEVEPHYMDHFKSPQPLSTKKRFEPINLSHSLSLGNLAPFGKPDSTKTLPSQFNFKEKYTNKRVLEVEPVHKLDLGLKLAISTMNYRDRLTAEQVAYCLDDIIKAIEDGKDSAARKKVENSIVKEKRLEAERLEAEKKKQQEKQKKGHEYMVLKGKEVTEAQAEKNKQKAAQEEEKKKNEEIAEQKKRDAANKFWKERKDALKDKPLTQIEKTGEQSKPTKESLQFKIKAGIKMKSEQSSPVRLNPKEVQKRVQDHLDKVKEQSQKKQEKQNLLTEEKKLNKTQVGVVPAKIKTKDEKLEKQRENFEELVKSDEVSSVFKEQDFKLGLLFDSLAKQTFREVSRAQMSEEELSLKTFSWFIHKFNIHPEILKDKNDIAVIYNSVSKHKKVVDFKPIGINQKEFREAMMKIAIKGAPVFNRIAESLAKGKNIEQSSAESIQKVDNQGEGEQEKADAKTLNALIQYLGLPNDKIGVNEALKNAIESGSKPNKILKLELNSKIVSDPKDMLRYKNQPTNSKRTLTQSGKDSNQQLLINEPANEGNLNEDGVEQNLDDS